MVIVAMTMPIQFCVFYFPYCTEKHRCAKRSSSALRGIKEQGGRADSERVKDREMRQGLVLGEKKSGASGPVTKLLGHP